jgi:hypothetical protein
MLVQTSGWNLHSRPQLQDSRRPPQQQDADKQLLNLAQKGFAEIGDRAMIRVQVPCAEAKEQMRLYGGKR